MWGNTKSLHLSTHETLQRQQGLHNVVEPGSSGCRITAKSTGILYIHSYIYIYLAQGISHGIAMSVVDWIKQPASKSGGSMATSMWRPGIAMNVVQNFTQSNTFVSRGGTLGKCLSVCTCTPCTSHFLYLDVYTLPKYIYSVLVLSLSPNSSSPCLQADVDVDAK